VKGWAAAEVGAWHPWAWRQDYPVSSVTPQASVTGPVAPSTTFKTGIRPAAPRWASIMRPSG
jgi:hypothetical protein